MRPLLIIATLAVILFSACKTLDKLTMFDIPYTAMLTMPASPVLNLPINLTTPDIETNVAATFDANDTSTDLVEEILLKEMTIVVTSPLSGDLDFLKSIEIFLNAGTLPEVRIAWDEDVESGVGATLDLETTTEGLKDYLINDTFSLRLKAVNDRTTSEDYDIEIRTTFEVDAKILGQ